MRRAPQASVRVDSLVQGLGLLVLAVGLTWGLFLMLQAESHSPTTKTDSTSTFAPPGSFSHRTLCHIQGAKLINHNTDALQLQVWYRLNGGQTAEQRRGTLVTAARAGCATIDACLAHLPDPFECFYDATKRSVGLVDDSTPMITVETSHDNGTGVVVVHEQQPATLDRRGWVLFVVLSLCLCTPVCCLLGVVSVLEGLGIAVPCRFDDARCAVRQRLDRLQRPTPGSPSARKGKWRS